MKKNIFLLVLMVSLTISAQSNQIKVDLFDVIALKTLDVSYERQLNNEASVGLSTFINFESRNTKFRYKQDFQITPYFRQIITRTGSFDIFGELFGSLNFGKTKQSINAEKLVVKQARNYSDFALGLGLGARHISENGYIFGANIDIGRNLFNTRLSPQFIPRLGISVGKQF